MAIGKAVAQNPADSVQISKLYQEALRHPAAYTWLEYLCQKIGGRLSGSPQAAAAVEFTRQVMDTLELDRVYLQEVMVPHWVRGRAEVGKAISARLGTADFRVCALGNSVGTGPGGLLAPIVEVHNFEELKSLGTAKVQGRIVFFNTPMNPTYLRTFQAYGETAQYRFNGPSEAAKLGAVGVIVRSLGSSLDPYPHTGSLGYQLNVPKIPALAISTLDAEQLQQLLQKDPGLQFYMESHCEMRPDKLSYNVVGEIRGSLYPDEIIVVGGHLDSWDLGEGAHDDGAGCMQAIEVLRLFKRLHLQPKRTLRAVMYMNEENGLRGGKRYAEMAEDAREKHIAALESDAGGFSPRSIGISDDAQGFAPYQNWQSLFDPYEIRLENGGGGADISPLRNQGTVLMGLRPDSQRYFDYHHTAIDTFDKVNWRELQLGAATMAAMLYLLSEYGTP
ncbi:MAG: M28 family peptidase [Microscillaceae bacterium]